MLTGSYTPPHARVPARKVQGLYTKTRPATVSTPSGFYALAMDPAVAGRVWMQSLDFSVLCFTDNGGLTVTGAVTPAYSGAMHQLSFSASHAWLVTGSNISKNGQVWQSPLPNSSGSGFTWTKVWDLAAPYGSITVGTESFFRPQCLAIEDDPVPNGSNAKLYLLEYGTTVVGGPSVYYSPDEGATWTKSFTFPNARHGHAIHVINGAPVAMFGDAGFTGSGLYRATSATAAAWNPISLRGEAGGGNTHYGINFQPITVGNKQMLVIEYDGALNLGPLFFPDTGATAKIWPMRESFKLPMQYFGTMRSLTLTSEGNLMWVQTTENGDFGPTDSIWIAKSPFDEDPVLLDTFPTSTMYLGNPVEDGDFVWFGYYRCHKEKFIGQ